MILPKLEDNGRVEKEVSSSANYGRVGENDDTIRRSIIRSVVRL